MSGVPSIVSHISSSDLLDRCDLSESLGETTLLPLDIHTRQCFSKKRHAFPCSPPCRRLFAIPTSNILLPLLRVFRNSVPITHTLFSFLPSSGDIVRWRHPSPQPSSAGCCLRTGIFLFKVTFSPSKCGFSLTNVLSASLFLRYLNYL